MLVSLRSLGLGVALLAAVAFVFLLATSAPAQYRPGGPGFSGGPSIPQPHIPRPSIPGAHPNGVIPSQPGYRDPTMQRPLAEPPEFNPSAYNPPPIPVYESTPSYVDVWSCSKCNRELGQGAKPNITKCPYCGTSLGGGFGGLGGSPRLIAGAIGLVVAVVIGLVRWGMNR